MNKPMVDKTMEPKVFDHIKQGMSEAIDYANGNPQPGTIVHEAPPVPVPGSSQGETPPQAASSALVAYDFGDEAGGGMENIDRDEIRIPFLIVLQTNSPQCKPVEAGGIPNAVAGMIYNTSSGALYAGKNGIPFVPAKRDYNFIEYVPRDAGGGLVTIYDKHDPNVEALRAKQGKFGKLKTANGNEIVQTMYIYGMFAPEQGSAFPAIIPFKSTQIGKYQRFVDRMNNEKYQQPDGSMKPAALWMHRWRLTTNYEKNKKGEFYGWGLRLDTLRPDGSEENIRNCILKASDPLRQAAKAFNTSIDSGAAKADYTKADMKNDEAEVPF